MDLPVSAKFSRKQICIRLLYTLLFMVVLEILKFIIQLTVVFQYTYLLITQQYNQPVRVFANKTAVYAYRVMRYLGLNENARPFPFSDFPQELEASEGPVQFS